MVVLELSIFPLDKGESVSAYVARAVDLIDRSGLDYQCHAMGTLIEGTFEQVMGVVRQCFEALSADCDRIECHLALDYRKGRSGRLLGKVASVEQKVGRPLKKEAPPPRA